MTAAPFSRLSAAKACLAALLLLAVESGRQPTHALSEGSAGALHVVRAAEDHHVGSVAAGQGSIIAAPAGLLNHTSRVHRPAQIPVPHIPAVAKTPSPAAVAHRLMAAKAESKADVERAGEGGEAAAKAVVADAEAEAEANTKAKKAEPKVEVEHHALLKATTPIAKTPAARSAPVAVTAVAAKTPAKAPLASKVAPSPKPASISVTAPPSLKEKTKMPWSPQPTSPALSNPHLMHLPHFLAQEAAECKCEYQETCSCEGTMQFMECIAKACDNDKCDCHALQFKHACVSIANICGDLEIECNEEKAACLFEEEARLGLEEPPAHDSAEDIYDELADLKEQKCQAEQAADDGWLNANSVKKEAKAKVDGLMAELHARRMKTPEMHCEKHFEEWHYPAPIPKNGVARTSMVGLLVAAASLAVA